VKRSTDRILTSHTGNLPRPADLESAAGDAFTSRLPVAVADVVERQIAAGLDQVNDGEYVKRSGFGGYIRERMQGIEVRQQGPRPGLGSAWQGNRTGARDQTEFPGFHETHKNNSSVSGSFIRTSDGGGWAPGQNTGLVQVCTGAVTYIGHTAIQQDIASLKAALHSHPGVEGFIASLGPGTYSAAPINEYYPDQTAFLFGVADALHDEYQAITAAGLILQIDEPELARAWQFFPNMTMAEYRDYTALRVEAINRALRGIPSEQVRLHFCWGSGHRPHKNDVQLGDIMDVIFKANVQCYAFEASNPRHEWEWRVFETLKLPPGKLLMPGVVGHATDIVEHPRLIADRLVRYARLVGRENVVGGTDCGLGTRNGHAEITWAKLEAMAEGAHLASDELWERQPRAKQHGRETLHAV
jgi:5-methyltetrahydropteroyltriglutamate--homocysteine methyltransferase